MPFHSIIGNSKRMRQVFRRIETVAPLDIPVLIAGESGTGKELVAQAIHRLSSRKDHPFIPVNTGAIPRELINSELFGHEKGAFTGAGKQHRGLFELADKGSILLDEISTMDERTQIALLRVLETGRFKRVGGAAYLTTRARVIAATNENLRKRIRKGLFRRDLYHRLRVFTIALPPLRKRKTDIDLLANTFLQDYADEFGKEIDGFSPEAIELIRKYPWFGNVRELENTLSEAVIMCSGSELSADCLPLRMRRRDRRKKTFKVPLGLTLEELEQGYINETLRFVGGNKEEASRLLGISRKTLYNKLKKEEDTTEQHG